MTTTLETLGYDSFFETNRINLGFGDFSVARVTAEHRGIYVVITENGEYSARLSGKLMHVALKREDYPAVGDWVVATKADDTTVSIRGILPRKTVLKRIFGDKNRQGEKTSTQVLGANIDVAFIVEAVGRDYNLNRYERYRTLAESAGIRPVFILNKTDLITIEELDIKLAEIQSRFPQIEIILTSVQSAESIDNLKSVLIAGETYCFLGSSGVGKSSLINMLRETITIKTEAISERTKRGKHVTTNREMYFLPEGGIVIDNPGIREVGLADTSEAVQDTFRTITALAKQCKFQDCTHIHEPGCAIRAAVESGDVQREAYDNFISLKKEADFYEMSEYEKRDKDRRFGKFIKSAKEDLKKFKR